MLIKFVYTLVYIILPSILIAHRAQVATGTAVKVVTVNQEDRSIGEFVDDTIIKTLIKNTLNNFNNLRIKEAKKVKKLIKKECGKI